MMSTEFIVLKCNVCNGVCFVNSALFSRNPTGGDLILAWCPHCKEDEISSVIDEDSFY